MTSETNPTNQRRQLQRQLRSQLRQRRRALSATDQCEHARQVATHFLRSHLGWRMGYVAAYWPTDGELDPTPLLRRLHAMGRPLALPVIAAGRMAFYAWRPGDALQSNRYGIGEPAQGAAYIDTRRIRTMLTPLVAFDGKGNRLGMGGGYYDRHLGQLAPRLRPTLVGLAHSLQQVDQLHTNSWDIPLQAVITEQGCLF